MSLGNMLTRQRAMERKLAELDVRDPESAYINVRWYGASPSASAATNTTAIQNALNQAASDGLRCYAPAGNYQFTQLTLPDVRCHFFGDGPDTILTCTGTGNAVILDANVTGGHALTLRDFKLVGSATAGHGLYLAGLGAGKNLLTSRVENVYITTFTNTGKYGVYCEDTYNLTFEGCRIEDTYHGMGFGNEAISVQINNCWINLFDYYGIHVNHSTAKVKVNNGILDSAGATPTTQIGIYCQAGDLSVNGLHFEDIYKPYQADAAAGDFRIYNCVFAGGFTVNPTIADITTTTGFAFLSGNKSVTGITHEVGLRSFWESNYMKIQPPTVTDGGDMGSAASVIKIAATGAQSINGFTSNAQSYTGVIALEFQDGNTTINHNASGSVDGYILTRDGLKWNPHADDVLYLRVMDSGAPFVEIGRTETDLLVEKTADYTVVYGDHGRSFSNEGAGATVTFTLPTVAGASSAPAEGLTLRFIRVASQSLRVDPNASEFIRGGGAGKYLQLDNDGDSVTLMHLGAGSVWDIVASRGAPSYEP